MTLRQLSILCLSFPVVFIFTMLFSFNSCKISENRCMEQGKYYMGERDFLKAKTYLTEAIKQNPGNIDAYMLRAKCNMDSDSLTAAIKDYTHVINLKPSGDNYYLRACTYYVDSQDTLSKNDFRKACDLNHNKSCDLYRKYYK